MSPASALSDAPWLPRLMRGIAIAAMIPMITTTMTNSIRLNPRVFLLLRRMTGLRKTGKPRFRLQGVLHRVPAGQNAVADGGDRGNRPNHNQPGNQRVLQYFAAPFVP